MTDQLFQAKVLAIEVYCSSRTEGKCPEEAAQTAWMAARTVLKSCRAPNWDVAHNTSRRNYFSPLGELIGIPGADRSDDYCFKGDCKTQEIEEMRTAVLAELENRR